MNITFSISFYCRQSKQNAKGYAPIEVRVSINGDSILTSLPRKAKPKEFKKAMMSKHQTDIKIFTSAIYSKIEKLHLNLLLEGKVLQRHSQELYLLWIY